jgi:hypothetical protein
MLSLLISCKRDAIDFDNFDDLTISPAIQTPLVKATLNLEDLLVTDSILLEDPDGGLRIVFNEEDIFGLSVIDFIEIPPQSPTTIPLVYDMGNNNPLFVDLALGTLAGAELTSATFDNGFLAYEITTATSINSDVDIRFSINNATINGNVFTNVFTLPAGSTSYKDSVSVEDLIFDLSNNGTAINFFGLEVEIISAADASQGQLFNLAINFTGLEIDNAQGDFGSRVINIPTGSFDIDLSALENFANGFFLTNPTFRLDIENGLGIELDLDLDLLGINNQSDVADLGLQTQSVASPSSPGNVLNSSITIDKDNSEIVNFLAALPQSITYGGTGTLNPSAGGGGVVTNFIDKSSSINADLVIDLPLEFRAEGMELVEEVELSLFDEDNEDTDQIETLGLFFRTLNGFPFDVNVNIAFIDTITGDSLDGVDLTLLTAAPVDGSGQVTQRVTSDDKVVFDKEQIDGLLKANQLRITARVNTANNGQTSVKLFTDYDLEIRMAAETSLNIPLNNED